MVEVFESDAELYGSVIATKAIVQTSVKVRIPIRRQVVLEEASIAVAWSLVLLINVGLLTVRHLV